MISVWHDIGSDGAEELEGSNEFQMYKLHMQEEIRTRQVQKERKKIEAGCFRYF
jgi:hypothetical protein